MKAKDLMIGDWVENPKHTQVFQIVGMEIMPKGDACRLKNDEYNCDTWCDRIRPIPLTEEILEANGFETDEVQYEFYDGYNFLLANGKGISVAVGSIWYVHELQHALRLCGLNELADNFKVE